MTCDYQSTATKDIEGNGGRAKYTEFWESNKFFT
jgi:hypothetical protein